MLSDEVGGARNGIVSQEKRVRAVFRGGSGGGSICGGGVILRWWLEMERDVKGIYVGVCG